VNWRASIALAGAPRHGDAAEAICAVCVLALGLLAYGTLLLGLGGWLCGAVCIGIAAFSAFLLVLQIGHNASHCSVTGRPAIDKMLLFWTFAIVGVDGGQWRERHLKLHHRVVNLPGTGIDADSISLVRLAPDKTWHWWMRLQPLYGPLIFAVGHISLVWLEDLANFHGVKAWRARTSFVAGKAVHVVLFLLVPLIVLAPTWAALVLGYLEASIVIALCFSVLVIGTHISDLAEFPQPDANGRLGHDWATHQVVTSVDWSPESRWATLLTGGANAHVAHHLFPGYSHRHAPALSRAIADAAAANGINHRVTSFPGMVAGQWRHLLSLSRKST
jgi:linoleoyl-CoA desaturase